MRTSPQVQIGLARPSDSRSSEAHLAADRALPERLALACHLLADIRDFLVSPELPMAEELLDLAIERIIEAQERLPAVLLLTYSVDAGYPQLRETAFDRAAAPMKDTSDRPAAGRDAA